ncbi:TetR/AcrR family transcriptional regulator [Novosphingobium sp.]|uniref:TetR/AcrR family transcriptional regulator n=1 Tax=Novosphingobium sp. TaxID=1874826 RepID=UPI003569A366
MRVKTDARREAILEIATQLFREVGYERASMAIISTRVGGSKATLYNYFKSKEELFAAAMLGALEAQGQSIIDMLDGESDDLETVLCGFGEAYLRLVTDPETLAITRTAISESANGTLGATLYEHGPRRAWVAVADYVERLQKRGLIGTGDPSLIAAQFKGLLEADFLEPLLWGATTVRSVTCATASAVATFMKAFATNVKKAIDH